MASRRPEQKQIYYSSHDIKEFVDNYTADESVVTNSSGSYLIESHILNDILPKNQEAAQKIFDLYGAPDGQNMERVMENIYSIYAAGIMNKSAYDNGRDLVSYQYQDIVLRPYNDIIRTDDINDPEYVHEREYYYLSLKRFKDTLKEYLDMHPELNEKDPIACTKLEQDIYELEHIIELDGEKDKVIYSDSLNYVFMTVLKNWEYVKEYTYTYRLMVAICRIHTWQTTADTRLKLVDIIKRLSAAWDSGETKEK